MSVERSSSTSKSNPFIDNWNEEKIQLFVKIYFDNF